MSTAGGVVLVGNDVVDLTCPAAAASARRARFVERVCSARERALVREAPDPALTLWKLFAAKEAAYKVLAKRSPGSAFAHRHFEVSPCFDEVRHPELRVFLALEVTPERVHAVASTEARPLLTGVAPVPAGASASAAARRLLREEVAARVGCRVQELEVVREPRPGSWDGFAPPVLCLRGIRVRADVSLSHDGPYVAFAAAGPALPDAAEAGNELFPGDPTRAGRRCRPAPIRRAAPTALLGSPPR